MAKSRINPYKFFYVAAALICLFITALFYFYFNTNLLLCYLVGINIASFLLLGYDKGASQNQSSRVPEMVLLVAAFIGGSAAMLIGMHILRHKTRKASFQIMIALILSLQILIYKFYIE